ncbi:ABC transporter substrate-binding protein [Lysinibacillus boronitolerans]|uniref:ABC transporter substrate-binding protein n=1 Tax=Lysinibacillus boronitolerans TaxID=309788 RepID=UPI0035E3CFDF
MKGGSAGMKQKSKWLLLLLLLLVVGLVGCNTNEKITTSATPDNEEKPKTEEVSLTIGSWRTEDVAKYEKVIALFNEQHPDIHVSFNPTKNTEYNTVLNTALQAGEGPDIFHLRPYAAGLKLAEAGYVEKINGLNGLSVFPEEALKASRDDQGNQYGVPINLSSTQFFYNKKIFKDNNLEIPTTWDEFMALNDQLLEKGITPIAMGTKEGWLLSLLHGIVGPAVYGGNDFYQAVLGGEKDFTDAKFIESIQVMNDLKKYFPANSEGLGMDDIRTLFALEDAAMFPLGSWEIPVVLEMNPDLDLGYFPIPSKEGNKTVTTWVDGSFAINANSKNKEAAKAFLEFLTTKEFGELFVKEFSMISAIPGITSDDVLLNDISHSTANEATPYMWVTNFTGGDPTTKSLLESELQGMYLGQVTPEEVAAKIQENAKTWFTPFQK